MGRSTAWVGGELRTGGFALAQLALIVINKLLGSLGLHNELFDCPMAKELQCEWALGPRRGFRMTSSLKTKTHWCPGAAPEMCTSYEH